MQEEEEDERDEQEEEEKGHLDASDSSALFLRSSRNINLTGNFNTVKP